MKDELRSKTVGNRECEIVYLQNSELAGSHWVMYYKDYIHTIAYSIFGDLAQQELIDYLRDKEEEATKIYTSEIQIEDFSERSCGYYCIAILYLLSQKIPFEDIILGFKGGERSERMKTRSLPLVKEGAAKPPHQRLTDKRRERRELRLLRSLLSLPPNEHFLHFSAGPRHRLLKE